MFNMPNMYIWIENMHFHLILHNVEKDMYAFMGGYVYIYSGWVIYVPQAKN